MSAASPEPDRPAAALTEYESSPADQESAQSQGVQSGQEATPRSLLDDVIDAAPRRDDDAASPLDQFLAERDDLRALSRWIRSSRWRRQGQSWRDTALLISRDIAEIDRLLTDQTNAILHHDRFQRLEASWRGLAYLLESVDPDENIKVRVLDCSWKDLERDFERATEFDQSQVFKKIYESEFGMPGGEPFGLLLGDYYVRPGPRRGHPHDDMGVLTSMSQVAAAAFCPFVTSAHPSMFGLDSFTELEQPINLESTFTQHEFDAWNRFRNKPESRFTGLTAPRVLMRLPYEDDGTRVDGFRFEENVETPDRSRYLWGNACFAFGAVAARAFATYGWPADVRGVQRDVEAGGLVTGLPVHNFGTDSDGIALKSSTEVNITDNQDKELGDLGFLPICACKDTEYSAFFGSHSCQKPKVYDRVPATVNARLSSMLQYMLCVGRFAHYIKVMARDKIGSVTRAEDLEDHLNQWLQQYCVVDPKASFEQKASYPLREGQVQITSQPGKPGSFSCVVHLRPHFQLDQLVSSVKLVTELAPGKDG